MARISGLCAFLGILAASVAAPLPIALLASLIDRGTDPAFVVMLFGVPIALLHSAMLGLPGFVILAGYFRPNWWRVMLAGFLIGALPIGTLYLWAPTDWATFVWTELAMGFSGATGALAFWAIVRHEPI